jgi:hypothetical protein
MSTLRRRLIVALAALSLVGVGAAIGASQDTNAELYDLLETSSIHTRYVKQNPGEAAKIETYWRSGGAKPTVATAYGKFLVEVNEDRAPTPPPPPAAACGDGLDNDGDGKVDFNDPGCESATDTDETDPTPPPPAGTIQPGQSWQAAYDAAPSSSTLTVAAGNHGSPSLTGTKAVTFLGLNGAVVSKMPGNASNVTFDNIDINTGSTHGQYNASEPRGTNITWRRVDVTGNWASVHTWDSATGFRWIGGSLLAPGQRNCSSADGQPLWLGADNATIDGVTFGVFDSGDCGSSGAFHMEAIRVQGASDIRVLNVTFSAGSDTGSGHIFVTTTSPSARQPRRLTVINTIFPPVIGSYAIQVHGNVNPIDGWVIRTSRFDQGVLNQAPFTNLTACGNTGSVPTSWKAPC